MVVTLTKMIIINDDNVLVISLTKMMVVVVVTIRVDGVRTCTTFATNATDIFSIRGGV